MDLGTGIAIGVPIGSALIAAIIKAWPINSNNNKYVRSDVCLARVGEIRSLLKSVDEKVTAVHADLRGDILEIKQIVEKLRS